MHKDVGIRARQLFEADYGCAESVLMAIAEDLGVASDIIPKIATGFCGGMARTCGLCGAVSGAVMGLGLVTGRGSNKDSEDANYQLVRQVLADFNTEFGSVNCRDLTGCDLGTEDGRRYFKDNKVRQRCAGFVEAAARLAAGAL